MPSQIRNGKDIKCKPFKSHHEEQLKLVTDFSWIDFDSLKDVDRPIANTLSSDGANEYIDENRIDAIIESVCQRIDNLSKLQTKGG